MEIRNNYWLEAKLLNIWQEYFGDIEKKNKVKIRFGKRAKNQLGCILLEKDGTTVIRITSYFKNISVPDFVVESTIIHELIHYCHGFSSPLPQSYAHPHKGGVMRKEYIKRGLENYFVDSKKWLKENWAEFIIKNKI